MDRKLRSRKKLKYKSFLLPIICISLAFIVSGMAFIQSTLSINGTTAMNASWSVHFENIEETEGSMEAVSPATINESDNTKIDFSLAFNNPKDFYEFEVDVVNSGTINTMISSISLGGLPDNIRPYVTYAMTYADGTDIKLNDELAKDSRTRIRVSVRFKDNMNLGYLFKEEDLNFDLSFSLEYIQVNNRKASDSKIKVEILGQEMIAYMDNMNSPYVKTDSYYENLYNISGIYFGKDPSNTNGRGLYVRAGTENDDYPIYYFRGGYDADDDGIEDYLNNNVLFADKCWKIVRTTETGGTKLIYNGKPDNSNTKGKCANTGEDSQIGYSAFNSSYDNLAYVGYMYSSAAMNYPVRSIYMGSSGTIEYDVLAVNPIDGNEYVNVEMEYINDYENEELQSDESEVDINSLYTFDSATKKWTSNMHRHNGHAFIKFSVATSGNYIFSYNVISESGYDYASLYINDNLIQTRIINSEYIILDNLSSTDVIKVEYSKDGSVTSNPDNIVFSIGTSLETNTVDNRWVYGNSVIYEDGKYTLQDTKKVTWGDNISKHHYTCFSTSDNCTTVNYITEVNRDNRDSAYYISFKDGKTIEDMLNETLPNDETRNQADSTMKSYLDSWFAGDSGLLKYLDYIEDTVWCSDRTIHSEGGYKPNGGLITSDFDYESRYNINSPSFACENSLDRFTLKSTVKNNNPDLEGNNTLDYPVGLLTFDEIQFGGMGKKSFLYTSYDYWLLSPIGIYVNCANGVYFNYEGSYKYAATSSWFGVRPSISLNKDVRVVGGTGSISNPYIINE